MEGRCSQWQHKEEAICRQDSCLFHKPFYMYNFLCNVWFNSLKWSGALQCYWQISFFIFISDATAGQVEESRRKQEKEMPWMKVWRRRICNVNNWCWKFLNSIGPSFRHWIFGLFHFTRESDANCGSVRTGRQRRVKAERTENSLVIVKLKVTRCRSCQAVQHVDSMMGHCGVAFAFTNKLVSLMAVGVWVQRRFACNEFVKMLSCILFSLLGTDWRMI